MKPEAQRIAIAEACPKVARIDGAGVPVWNDLWEYPESSGSRCRVEFDPLNDLNAMHEAEKELFSSDGDMARRIYGGYLVSLANGKLSQAFEPCRLDWWHSQHATAAQRAEAFLRTIGKWTDA